MKKLVIMLTALLTISLSACSQSNKKENKEMKVLVAYFSATGVTKGVAQQLAEVAGADLHEIKPAQAYTDADLDWHNKQSRSSVEMKDKSSRPAITAKLQNMKDYDVVYVGFPSGGTPARRLSIPLWKHTISRARPSSPSLPLGAAVSRKPAKI